MAFQPVIQVALRESFVLPIDRMTTHLRCDPNSVTHKYQIIQSNFRILGHETGSL
jgi:hypothetical protein